MLYQVIGDSNNNTTATNNNNVLEISLITAIFETMKQMCSKFCNVSMGLSTMKS